jgi:hypothetical protein
MCVAVDEESQRSGPRGCDEFESPRFRVARAIKKLVDSCGSECDHRIDNRIRLRSVHWARDWAANELLLKLDCPPTGVAEKFNLNELKEELGLDRALCQRCGVTRWIRVPAPFNDSASIDVCYTCHHPFPGPETDYLADNSRKPFIGSCESQSGLR